MLKHTSICVQGQVLKSSKGRLDEEIPEPSLLAYPSHHVRVVAKHIFSIVNKSRAQQRGFTIVDALKIKKDWGYMIKKSGKKIEKLSEASKVPLEHMFNSHDNYIAEWCFKTRAPEEGKTYTETDDIFRCKKMTIICTISGRRLFPCFKQIKF